ncbi:MAG TPA: alpha/beta fold hydrolase [Planctomycetota bacterium]|nr:alpha/beta fold hydrolase [Planctomycetota bacterium]
MVREEVLRAGGDGSLVGIASFPDQPARAGVVLLNAGLVHRVGPARLWVALARRSSELGLATLRLDFSGIGDSPETAASARFEARAPKEARAGMDALAAASGVERFALIGLCSGAEMAFKTALEDPRVRELVLINSPRFLEEPSAELVARLEKQQDARYYWRVALRNPRSWWKALRGKADLRAMARAALLRVRSRETRPAGAPDSADARAFRTLVQRGTNVHLVLSEGDWGQDYLDAILGASFDAGGASGKIQRTIVPACDHLLTPLAAQRALLDHVERLARTWI